MQNKVKLITGACGEIGQALMKEFSKEHVITIDLNKISSSYANHRHIVGSILDNDLLDEINNQYQIDEIYHLAAVLSTKAEQNPQLAHDVNVNGTNNLYNLSLYQIKKYNQPLKFFFPSSIAIYNLIGNNTIDKINENQYCDNPYTIYGQSKLLCEKNGINYAKSINNFDFRCIRFPGIISSETMPSGGTSDYASEIIHAAINNNKYSCFVKDETKLPFIVMPDAIVAIIKLMNVRKNQLNQHIYNITSFSLTAQDLINKIKEYNANFNIDFNIDNDRQNIVDSWPSDVDDLLAKNDWGWEALYNFNNAFSNYLIPNLYKKYNIKRNV